MSPTFSRSSNPTASSWQYLAASCSYTAQPGVATADMLNRVLQHKVAIVAYLGEQDSATTHEASGEDSRTAREIATDTASKDSDCPDFNAIDSDSPPTTKRLIGCGFTSRATKQPPSSILADPVVICPRCNRSRVLPELTSMTGGLCWECHL